MTHGLTIAAIHVDPRLTVPLAVLVAIGLVAYWFHLGRPDVEAPRRRIRRVSLLLMLLSLPSFVRGLSFLDPAVHQKAYVLTWSVATLLVVMVFLTACADMLFTLAHHRRGVEKELRSARDDLVEAVRSREGDAR